MDDHPGKGKQMVIRVMLGRQVKEGKNSRRGRQVEGGWTISVWRSFVFVLSGVTLARKKLSCDYYWRPREKPTWKDPVLPMEWHTDDKNKWCKIKPNEPRLQNIQLRLSERYLSRGQGFLETTSSVNCPGKSLSGCFDYPFTACEPTRIFRLLCLVPQPSSHFLPPVAQTL